MTKPSRAVFSARPSSSSTGSHSGASTGSIRSSAGWPREDGEMESARVSNVGEVADAGRSTADRAGEYTLYCFAQSGNAYKCALALQLAGADWAPRFVDYFGGETRGHAYRDINIMGEAPVLEHRGMRLSQSGVILDYLAESFGRFGPAEA